MPTLIGGPADGTEIGGVVGNHLEIAVPESAPPVAFFAEGPALPTALGMSIEVYRRERVGRLAEHPCAAWLFSVNEWEAWVWSRMNADQALAEVTAASRPPDRWEMRAELPTAARYGVPV